jgi:hypothetical protein
MASLPILRHTKGVVFVRSISGGLTISSGQVLTADGTAAAPSYSFANKPSFGLMSSGASGIGVMDVVYNGAIKARLGDGSGGPGYGFLVASDGQYAFNSTSISANTAGTTNLYLRSLGAGILGVYNDSTHGVGLSVTTDGTLQVLTRAGADTAILRAATLRRTPVAFASLPTGAEGMTASVTDSTTATWGATISGGGANHVLAYHNGTNWTVAGK